MKSSIKKFVTKSVAAAAVFLSASSLFSTGALAAGGGTAFLGVSTDEIYTNTYFDITGGVSWTYANGPDTIEFAIVDSHSGFEAFRSYNVELDQKGRFTVGNVRIYAPGVYHVEINYGSVVIEQPDPLVIRVKEQMVKGEVFPMNGEVEVGAPVHVRGEFFVKDNSDPDFVYPEYMYVAAGCKCNADGSVTYSKVPVVWSDRNREYGEFTATLWLPDPGMYAVRAFFDKELRNPLVDAEGLDNPKYVFVTESQNDLVGQEEVVIEPGDQLNVEEYYETNNEIKMEDKFITPLELDVEDVDFGDEVEMEDAGMKLTLFQKVKIFVARILGL